MRRSWRVAGLVGLVVIVAGVVAVRGWQGQGKPGLDDENPAVRAAAVRSLPLRGNEERLIAALEDENADVRLLAAGRLGGATEKRAEGIAALVGALKDPHAGVRRQAVWSLEAMLSNGKEPTPWAEQVRPIILEALDRQAKDADPEVRRRVEEARRQLSR